MPVHPEWFVPAFIFVLIALALAYPFLARGRPADRVGCLGTGTGLLPGRRMQPAT